MLTSYLRNSPRSPHRMSREDSLVLHPQPRLSSSSEERKSRVLSGILTRRKLQVTMSRASTARSRTNTERSKKDDEQYQLLEYELPDLPPIKEIKDAVSRQRICSGMAYILPVDKGKNGVENVFRTDLRYMFREPYRNSLISYNDTRVSEGAHHHFVPNTPSERYRQSPDDYTKYVLNSDSEKIRTRYSHSAPPKGLTGKFTTPNSQELRTRSTLYLQIKTKLPPEAIRMKEEADKILQSVQEETDYAEQKKQERTNENVDKENRQGSPVQHSPYSNIVQGNPKEVKRVQFKDMDRLPNKYSKERKAIRFKSYEDLKTMKLPNKPILPDDFKSPYLTEAKNQDIWNWLTRDEIVTDFSHFMNVCS